MSKELTVETMTVAQLLQHAAELLEREEVEYALGLDYDHISTHEQQTVTNNQGRTYVIEVPRDEAEAQREMDDDINEHRRFVEALRKAAVTSTESSGLSVGCALGGNGYCDGLLSNGGSCVCSCHDGHWDGATDIKAWHDQMHIDTDESGTL
jgi:hypothetical protein